MSSSSSCRRDVLGSSELGIFVRSRVFGEPNRDAKVAAPTIAIGVVAIRERLKVLERAESRRELPSWEGSRSSFLLGRKLIKLSPGKEVEQVSSWVGSRSSFRNDARCSRTTAKRSTSAWWTEARRCWEGMFDLVVGVMFRDSILRKRTVYCYKKRENP